MEKHKLSKAHQAERTVEKVLALVVGAAFGALAGATCCTVTMAGLGLAAGAHCGLLGALSAAGYAAGVGFAGGTPLGALAAAFAAVRAV